MSHKKAHVIIVGNEKGGSGKTTTAMHVTCALLHMGYSVGIIDLDLRQRSLTRYMENRLSWMTRRETNLFMPKYARLRTDTHANLVKSKGSNAQKIDAAIDRISHVDFIVIDCPGSDSTFSRLAHARANTIITPMNDSFVDFDLLAHVDPDTMEVVAPSIYSEMIWESRKNRARIDGSKIDWIVMRNRQSQVNARNKEKLGNVLQSLSDRFGFRLTNGFTERIIYRELFLMGLTLLDLPNEKAGLNMSISHLSARQEIRNLISFLHLPDISLETFKKTSNDPIPKAYGAL